MAYSVEYLLGVNEVVVKVALVMCFESMTRQLNIMFNC